MFFGTAYAFKSLQNTKWIWEMAYFVATPIPRRRLLTLLAWLACQLPSLPCTSRFNIGLYCCGSLAWASFCTGFVKNAWGDCCECPWAQFPKTSRRIRSSRHNKYPVYCIRCLQWIGKICCSEKKWKGFYNFLCSLVPTLMLNLLHVSDSGIQQPRTKEWQSGSTGWLQWHNGVWPSRTSFSTWWKQGTGWIIKCHRSPVSHRICMFIGKT